MKKGISLLKKISKFHPGAQRFLGECYRDGNGVKVNKKLANKYLSKCKDNDYIDFFKEHPNILDTFLYEMFL